MWQLEEGINHQILGVKGLIQYMSGFFYTLLMRNKFFAQERCVEISMHLIWLFGIHPFFLTRYEVRTM